MDTRAKRLAMAHAAGIFADMSVDGPAIGTLVVIVDRAKNLPNRKTMGKQNPYCAARLGKEAKKTETDLRGGQTPRWDQELRYTVHESPDYFKLKVSIFNDDKKTDLIGETWIDLKPLIIPGGSQNDHWHPLQFRGKYAGEVRLEMTYYDTRPEDEAVIEKRLHAAEKVHMKKKKIGSGSGSSSSGSGSPSSASSISTSSSSLSGPRQLKDVKRRPLPTSAPSSDSSKETAIYRGTPSHESETTSAYFASSEGPTGYKTLPSSSPSISESSSAIVYEPARPHSSHVYPPVQRLGHWSPSNNSEISPIPRYHLPGCEPWTPDFKSYKSMQPRVEDESDEECPPPTPPRHRQKFHAPYEGEDAYERYRGIDAWGHSKDPEIYEDSDTTASWNPNWDPTAKQNPHNYDPISNPGVDSTCLVAHNAPTIEPEPAEEAGPIIGDDGREIDPSDYLPTASWAPEPERKTKKKPGVVVRFRSPVHREIPLRSAAPVVSHAHPAPEAPMITYSPVHREIPPRSAAPVVSHAHPALETTHAHPASEAPMINYVPVHREILPPRSAAPVVSHARPALESDYPTHAHPAMNRNYNQMDGNIDALNRELKMIDIGSGGYEDKRERDRGLDGRVQRYTLSYVSR
ncbi:hypothetical protein BO71DRAFT_481562 [Aspergillus ellipticus CBS 707.79]|uniref:C2 domain-containing protein n=1 Tax=Aspergillus ellipticus CBS 707.79 TaxID=1448320 RepID=A0A319DHX0_9EURO|nr:hypothetical protein BO71DRAFT_481562 [Aspergillus ellipticus CBS 707.79]